MTKVALQREVSGAGEQSVRIGFGLKRLTLDQFEVILAEIKVVINTQPLIYVCEEFQSGFSLTPIHFLNAT